jgi:hypothetical protein
MMTVTQFAKALAARRRRQKPYSRAYIHLLIGQRRIVPQPRKVSDYQQAPYLIDDKAVILPANSA